MTETEPLEDKSDDSRKLEEAKYREEQMLVRRAQGGDTDAFERLYRQHVGRIYALCLRLSGEVVMAEELTQDVFVRAWEKLPTFRGESTFHSWLHRLAVNVVLSEGRSRSRRNARVTMVEELPESAVGSRGESTDLSMDLERAISSLPPGARNVFVLHDIEGYRHIEIAELTGMAPGTSKAQLHWARKQLRELLTK